ncbi:NAD(P)-binding domain-containing protein [Nocardia sp. NPDC050378]|uniref:NAD(P)/FAD-dependent oxidoreductase n=1 Tax=Nocardia sp. NPDC050378 TaxID=3155400 RepID=UPI0033C1B648
MASTSRDEHGSTALTVVGDLWSPACAAVRTFLSRNEIACRWRQLADPEARRLLADHGFGAEDTPVLIDSAGRALRPMDEAQLARWVGLHTEPSSGDYDLMIVGGGPAGMAAAVYGASEGLRTVAPGAQLTDRERRQAGKFGAELVISSRAERLDVTPNGFTVRCTGGLEVSAKSVIIATGATFRTLDAPGIDRFTGRGVYYFSALTEAPLCAGSVVYIVGGANSAGQAAIYFAEGAARVIMLIRGSSPAAEMSGRRGFHGRDARPQVPARLTRAPLSDRSVVPTLVSTDPRPVAVLRELDPTGPRPDLRAALLEPAQR